MAQSARFQRSQRCQCPAWRDRVARPVAQLHSLRLPQNGALSKPVVEEHGGAERAIARSAVPSCPIAIRGSGKGNRTPKFDLMILGVAYLT
ncbi:hypothetical protein [Scytonema sp. PCC 10023]|uniref:hypothetical protein n=1 Tax=Scytonema sp. PCC 10023 TaxID=1680591 RepID=UPI0039C6896C